MQRGDRMECTAVGIDDQTHVMNGQRLGRDGHFPEEGAYRRAIERAVRENGR